MIQAKHPSGAGLIGLLILYLFIFLKPFNRDRSFNNNFDYFMEFYRIIFIVFYVSVILILLIRMFVKPFTIYLTQDSINVRGRMVKATDVKEIRVQVGRFGSLVGITPVGKRVTPIALCFRVMGDEVQAIGQITEWASMNHIKLSHRQIRKWL
ncbi:hypothetical protein ACK8P5_10765 [Paenibacillus sp. EC2-1]|uniref:hypothetical protein n=1 Tax=Paenibacillus sp. EC2-1 TaxID=3388665 RepID=UPI003BEF06B4